MRKYLILGLAILIVSCAEETETGNKITDFLSLHKKMPVVLSQFSTGSILFVEIRTTEPAFNKGDIGEIPKVLNPVIKDIKSGTSQTLLQSSYNGGVYFTKIRLTEGTAYQINIEFPGFDETHVSAIDTIPYLSRIKSAEVKPRARKTDNDLLAGVQLEISPSSFQNILYYEISVVTTITDTTDFYGFPIDSTMSAPTNSHLYSDNPLITKEDYYPSILQFDASPPTDLYFKKGNNTGPFCIDFYYSPPAATKTDLSTGKTTTRIYSHSAAIILKTVSYNYYQYNVSRLKQFYSRKGDPLYGVGEPVNVYSNIKNGTGIFASYACDSVNYYYKSE